MQRFPDHWAQPSEERVTYENHRRTGASLRLPMSASVSSSRWTQAHHLLENVSLKMSYSPTYASLRMENAPITV
jgi:hypothetical protein